MVKIPNWPEAKQLTIYKRGLEVALWTTENMLPCCHAAMLPSLTYSD